MRFFFSAWVLFLFAATCGAQAAAPGELLDSDHDGLADQQEMSLLAQFEPRFLISRDDCSSQPAELTAFAEEARAPARAAEEQRSHDRIFIPGGGGRAAQDAA